MPSITATTPEQCLCCTPIPALFYCRLREGMPGLVGFTEFTNPSSPPRYYLKKTFEGVVQRCVWGQGATCTLDEGLTAWGYDVPGSGSVWYDRITGAFGGNQERYTADSKVNTAADPDFSYCEVDGSTFRLGSPPTWYGITSRVDSANSIFTQSQTVESATYDGVCRSSGMLVTKTTGTLTATLSDEDTEEDAARRWAVTANWGMWYSPGGWGCYDYSCCVARWQVRTSGAYFWYADLQTKVYKTGVLANQSWLAKIVIHRKLYDAPDSEYQLYQTMWVGVTSNGSGVVDSDPIDIPNARGYKTKVVSTTLYWSPAP